MMFTPCMITSKLLTANPDTLNTYTRPGTTATLTDTEIYDVAGDAWQRGADVPTGRSGVAAVALDGSVTLSGGTASGPAGNVRHKLTWLGDKANFKSAGNVTLPLNKAVTVPVTAITGIVDSTPGG